MERQNDGNLNSKGPLGSVKAEQGLVWPSCPGY